MLSQFAFAQKTRAESQVLRLQSEKLLRRFEQLRLNYVRLEARFNARTNVRQARIEQGKCFADMLTVLAGNRPFWYVLRHRDSDAILDQENFKTYEEALEAVRKALAKFNEALGKGAKAHSTN